MPTIFPPLVHLGLLLSIVSRKRIDGVEVPIEIAALCFNERLLRSVLFRPSGSPETKEMVSSDWTIDIFHTYGHHLGIHSATILMYDPREENELVKKLFPQAQPFFKGDAPHGIQKTSMLDRCPYHKQTPGHCATAHTIELFLRHPSSTPDEVQAFRKRAFSFNRGERKMLLQPLQPTPVPCCALRDTIPIYTLPSAPGSRKRSLPATSTSTDQHPTHHFSTPFSCPNCGTTGQVNIQWNAAPATQHTAAAPSDQIAIELRASDYFEITGTGTEVPPVPNKTVHDIPQDITDITPDSLLNTLPTLP